MHDEPIRIDDDRQRLTVALVQKKVSEVLGHEKFGSRFQIGMLASFESFAQTARVDADVEADSEPATFDGAEQTDDLTERHGVDVGVLNALARDHHRRFGRELPHPKMDALVDALASAWRDGDKALVFVRRVASVAELNRKLDAEYDAWLVARLRTLLDERHHPVLDLAVDTFRRQHRRSDSGSAANDGHPGNESQDVGGTDTFFAWFFRGRGPDGVVSGATIQERLGR
jgi:hypothetical protein